MPSSEFIFVKLAEGASKSDLNWSALSPAKGKQFESTVLPKFEGFTPDPAWDFVLQTHLPEGTAAPGPSQETPDFAERIFRYVTIEKIVIDGPRRGIRVLSLPRRKEGMTSDQFIHHYTQVHGPLVTKNETFVKMANRYVQNYAVVGSVVSPPGFIPYDGMSEFWMDSVEVAQTAWSAPDYIAQLRADEKNFVRNPPSDRLMVEERAIG